MMIQGDGFFIAKSGGESVYTRAGTFTFDANGSLTTPNGQIVQGWAADTEGTVNTAGAPGDIKLPIGISLAPEETTKFTLTGNLSFEAPVNATTPPATPTPGRSKVIPIPVVDANGTSSTLNVTMTKTGANEWTASTPSGASVVLPFVNGKPNDGAPITSITLDGLTADISDITHYSGNTEARVSASDGSGAGILSSYTVSNTGQIVGVFSNGLKQSLGQLALANFNNVNGLEKIGDSMFRSTVNSGLAQVGSAGSAGLGLITNGALEMSNVDLAQEFTNLVIAQRGFQANSRIITTSDEILQELVNLKR
jgi:flagellar hook protein FlgE